MRRHRSNKILWSLVCVIAGVVLGFLSAIVHPIFSGVNPAFFVAAIILALLTIEPRIRRSTVLITASILTGALATGITLMGVYIHPVFQHAGGPLIYVAIACALGLLGFARIVASLEIIRLSGILKLVILFAAGMALARLTVGVLESLRHKSHAAVFSEEQAQKPVSNPKQSVSTQPVQ